VAGDSPPVAQIPTLLVLKKVRAVSNSETVYFNVSFLDLLDTTHIPDFQNARYYSVQ
jgi:hypothetical protein